MIPLILFEAHPIWFGEGPRTDLWVASQVWTHSKSTSAFAASSSLPGFLYNILQFGIVQYSSAPHVAFAASFNKVATVALEMLMESQVGIFQSSGNWGRLKDTLL